MKNSQNLDKIKDLIPEDLNEYVGKYMKVFALSLIIPAIIVLVINEGAVLAKIGYWFWNDIEWTKDVKAIVLTVLMALALPAGFGYWFYNITLKKVLKHAHGDFIVKINKIIADELAKQILKYYHQGKGKAEKHNAASIMAAISKRIEGLPGLLSWIVKKLLGMLPLVDMVNSYDFTDLNEKNEDKISEGLETKINEYELQAIDGFVPGWLKWLIPLNIVLLVIYFFL